MSGCPVTPRRTLVEPLTKRELEILALVCDGLSTAEISDRTTITTPTVKYHLTNIYGKLGVVRRTQAVAVAIHLDLIRPVWLCGEPARDEASGAAASAADAECRPLPASAAPVGPPRFVPSKDAGFISRLNTPHYPQGGRLRA